MTGKTYVMADLHGCYDMYCRMLEKIRFSDEDQLYILGDLVDRGPDGIKIIRAVMKRKNVTVLPGNHDDTMYRILSLDKDQLPETKKTAYEEAMQAWLNDGGDATYAEYLKLPASEQNEVLHFVKSLACYKEMIINGQWFFMAHTVPELEVFKDQTCWNRLHFTWGKPEYERIYDKDLIIITGHTPTLLIDSNSDGRIWRGNNHIAIDCGAVFGRPLGCLCLETGEEFYVE